MLSTAERKAGEDERRAAGDQQIGDAEGQRQPVDRVDRYGAGHRLFGEAGDRQDDARQKDADPRRAFLDEEGAGEEHSFRAATGAHLRILDDVRHHRRAQDERADVAGGRGGEEDEQDRQQRGLPHIRQHMKQPQRVRRDVERRADRHRARRRARLAHLLADARRGDEGDQDAAEQRDRRIDEHDALEAPDIGVEIGRHRIADALHRIGAQARQHQDGEGAVLHRVRQFAQVLAERLTLDRRVGQIGDLLMRPRRRGQDRRAHQQGAEDRIADIALPVEQPVGMLRRRREEIEIGRHQHGEPARPPEQIAPRHDPRPLVIVRRQFGCQRDRGDLIGTHRGAHEDGAGEQPAERRALPPTGRRIPQQHPTDHDRQRRAIHPRVPPSPARARPIGQEAHGGVNEGIDQQGDHHDEADGGGGQADDLIVEQQQEGAKPGILHAIGDRSEGVAAHRTASQAPCRRYGRRPCCRLCHRSHASSCFVGDHSRAPGVVNHAFEFRVCSRFVQIIG
ncbi:hypothetical protein WR25_01934 [Diploscapter pachys]|uniref:Uncharacterized protein n=1 Tax=Diploscapter pachys TaxID=2018661 RepID=A0A2A2KFL0_9BILA|nr:hypothetical protein WR25_01934 [Diploscapter pachys]